MTEDIQVSDSAELDNVSAMIDGAEPAETQNAPVENAESGSEATPDVTQKEEEKLIPQSQVAKIAAREKREAEQRMQAMLQNERQQYQAEIAALRGIQAGSNTPPAGGQPIDQAQMAKAIQAEVQRMTQFNQAYQIAEQFESKMKSAILSDPDLGDIYDRLHIQKFPDFAVLANEFDNTAEIVREVGQHPRKYSEINTLLNAGLRELAQQEMARLSASIKQNQAAKNQKSPSQPLSQLKPSQGISVSDENKSVEDFRKIFGRRKG